MRYPDECSFSSLGIAPLLHVVCCHGAQVSWRTGVMAHGCVCLYQRGAQLSWRTAVMAHRCHGAQVSWRTGVMAHGCHGTRLCVLVPTWFVGNLVWQVDGCSIRCNHARLLITSAPALRAVREYIVHSRLSSLLSMRRWT